MGNKWFRGEERAANAGKERPFIDPAPYREGGTQVNDRDLIRLQG
jgi:hypothetical protein